MAIKQRFQHLTLGDTVRLQNFFYDNDASANTVTIVPKVEVFRVDPRLATNNNPRGLVRKATLLRRPGLPTNDLSPYPSLNNPDYWEGQLLIEQDQWEIGDFTDRWYLISDEDADLANPVAKAPLSPEDDFSGILPINVDNILDEMTIGTGAKSFDVRAALDFEVGDEVRLYAEGSTYMEGTITAYSGTSMSVNVASVAGTGTYDSWLLIKVSNTTNPVTTFVATLDKNRLPLPSGITTTSDTYTVSQLTTDLQAYTSAVINATANEGSSPSALVRRYVMADVGEQIVTDGKRASADDVAAFPTDFLEEGTYYTAFGQIRDGGVVAGYFKIAYDSGEDSNILVVQPESPLPSVYPSAGVTVVPYISGTTRIGPTIDITWNFDPDNDTDVIALNYGLYESVPAPISSASILGICGVLQANFQTLNDGSHVDASNCGQFALNSSDNGLTWNGVTYSTGFLSSEITAIQGSFNADTGKLTISVTWDNIPPNATKINLHYVDQWNLEIDYNPNVPNAWDDLITRLGPTKVTVVEHTFKVSPSLFFASARPIPVSYEFGVNPADYYVDSKSWMRVDVKPVANLNPESMRFHYATISAGTLRYEIYRIAVDGKTAKKILAGNIDWHEEATGMLRIDTTTSPLNKGMNGFVVFYLDLPDGSSVRSARIFINVIDDLRGGVRSTILGPVN